MTASNLLGTTASKILYSLLVDQLYPKEVNFCISPIFCIWTSQQKSPKQVATCHFNGLPPSGH